MKIQMELSVYELRQSESARAAGEAFGLERKTIEKALRSGSDLHLIATAEQFGAYVALRATYGGVNRIQTLKPKLIANPFDQVIDVSHQTLAYH